MPNSYTDKHKTIVTAEAIEPNRRVKLNASQLLVYADAGDDFVGVSQHYAASGAVLTIKLPNDSGTNLIEAAGTFAAGATVYGAADGKIDDTVSGDEIGQALEAATAAGDLIEVLQVSTSDTTLLDGITPGTQVALKAVIADANVNTGISKVTELHIGASGSEAQVLATPAEIDLQCDISAQTEAVTTGAISVTKRISVLDTTAGATLFTLAAPDSTMLGQVKVISFGTDNGDATITLTNVQGGTAATTATFANVGDELILVGGSTKWNVVSEGGVVLS